MTKYLLLPALLAGYIFIVFPFTAYMRSRVQIEKLGYVPQAEVLNLITADQKLFCANTLVLKTLMYFGGTAGNAAVPTPDYLSMFKHIETAVKLDPYNLDGYYFTQAIFAWDAKRVKEANSLLEYGMKFRSWDYQLPFSLGFNYAYFLKDYKNAAKYYKIAGDLSGVPLLINLAGRYMYESGETDLALAYLSAMEKSARDPNIKKEFQVRILAFNEVKRVEQAVARYRQDHGSFPKALDDLQRKGYLKEPPVDPYGGHFFIDEMGHVRTTSKFAYAEGGSAERGKDR